MSKRVEKKELDEAKKEKVVKKEKKKDAKKKEKKDSLFKQIKKEMSKVHFPTKKDMIKYSIATIVFVIFFAGYFYLIELVMAFIKSLI